VVPAFALTWHQRCRVDDAADDRFSVDVFQIDFILAFKRRVWMNQHVSLCIQNEDVALVLAPTAAGLAEFFERRIALRLDEICCIVDKLNEFTCCRILILL
jgi:hypothetical protein